MKAYRCVPFVAVTFLFLFLIAPKKASADYIVNNTDPACSTNSTPPCFTTIQSAINSWASLTTVGTTIQVKAGTYHEAVVLTPGISLHGSETAKTILTSGGTSTTGALITTSSGNASISNFTFSNATLGILVTNNATVDINNNVFYMGQAGTAVQVQSTTSTRIFDNTFYNNGSAINSNTDILITSNIFLSNIVALTSSLSQFTQLTYNDFFTNSTIASNGQQPDSVTNIFLDDPLFVNSGNGDFHLQAASPCRNTGNPASQYTNPSYYPPDPVALTVKSDMGAYGGPGTDSIPFQISGVATSGTSTTSVTLTWNANKSYLVGGYRVYYGNASGDYNGTGAAEGSSPVTVPTGTAATTFTLSGLTISAVTPSIPTLNPTAPLNESLALSWTAAPGATGYKVYYGTTSPPSTAIDVGNVTSYALSGLTNGQTYFVAVSAYAKSLLYLAVTARDISTGPFAPGVQHESAYSTEVTAGSGDLMESALSDVKSDFPEALVAYPNLPNTHQGCFIATAAFGYYSAPQVQALREFRDRYLVTNSLGNAFVEWYYRVSPAAAGFLNAHPGYKPAVRTALLPAIGISLLLTQMSSAMKIVLMILASCGIAYLYYRKRLSGSGGSC